MTLFGGNRTVSVTLSARVTGYVAAMQTAATKTRDVAKAANEAAGKHRRAFDEIGTGAIAAGAAIGAIGIAAVTSFAKFDKAMSRVAAGTGAAGTSLEALRKAALDAGARTAFSATEAADAITALGKAGVSTKDILGGGLDASLSLAAAGQLEVADAAEIAATAMVQFGLKGRDNITKVADLLAAGAGKAQGEVTDLANALKYVGPVAAGLGVSIEETTGALALLASQGILSEQAGTSLRGMLQALTSPSKQAKEELDALGIQLYDNQGAFLGLSNVAGQLQGALGGMSDAQREAALGTIFGNETITAAKVIYSGGAQAVKDWTAAVSDSGYAADQARLLMDNLSGDVEELTGSLETAFIQSGSGANDGLRALTQTATDAVNVFNALPAGLQKGTVVAAGLTAGALLLGGAMLKGAVAVRNMRDNLDDLGVSATRTKGAMAAVGKAGAAFTVLTFVPDLSRQISSSIGTIGDDLAGMSLELAKFAEGADLGAQSAKVFGSSFDGVDDWIGKTQSLKKAVNDLSGSNGWWNRDVPFLPSDEAMQIKQYSAALAQLAQKDGPAAAKAFDRMAKEAGLNKEETDRLLDLMPEYKGYLTEVAAAQVANGEATADAASASSVLADQMGGAAFAAEELAKQVEEANSAAEDFSSNYLSARAAARDYQAALDDARKSLEENGKTLDINTPKGRANAAALDAIATAAQKQAEGILATTGSQEQYRASLTKSREDLVKMAEKFYGSKKAAEAYADKVLAIPKDVTTTIKARTNQAASALGDVETLLKRIDGKTVSAAVIVNGFAKVRGIAGVAVAQADGSVLNFANGTESHVAQIAPAGAMRVWAEPETGGEAYIPLAAGKRSRSKAILAEVAKMFGGTLTFAEGGFAWSSPFGPSAVMRRYEDSRPEPITAAQVRAAINARKDAVAGVDRAERALAELRKKSPKDTRAIRDAEDRLDSARRRAAAARSKEADAIRRRDAPKGFQLGAYTKSLAQTVRQTTAYRANLQKIAKRGGNQLATLIEGMGEEGVQLAAALAKANPKEFARVLALLRKLEPEAFQKPAPEPTTTEVPGATVRAFAWGGIEDRRPQIAPAGSRMRIWNEPETGGEAYLPLADSKRGSALQVLGQVHQRFGLTGIPASAPQSSVRVMPAISAAASSAPGGGGASYGPLVHAERVEVIRGGPKDVADELMWQIRASGR